MSDNIISQAVSQIKSGAEPAAEKSSNVAYASESTEDKGWEPTESTEDSAEQPTEGSPETGADTDTAEPDAVEAKAKGTPTKEFITISDDKGKRKVEIDYSNRDSIKKAFSLAHGARKWQSERDSALQKAAQLEAKYGELSGTFSKLEQAFQENGEAGVLDLLAGKPGAHKEWAQRTIDRDRLKEKDPEAYRQMLRDERLEKLEREIERERTARAKDKEEVASQRDAADIASLESNVHPSFDKYRFDGKLSDSNSEQLFDEMLWTTALKRLEPYEAQNKLSKAVIDEKFREVSSMLRKQMGQQVEKKVAKVVEQKKQEATSNAQAATVSGYKGSSASKEAAELINKGDLASIFKGWGKYKNSFR